MRAICVHAANLELLDGLIDKVNRRAARAGIVETFSYETVAIETHTDQNGVVIEYLHVALNTPTLTLGAYEFVATVTEEEGGILVSTAPGQTLDGIGRPTDARHCDHCNTRRTRSASFLVRDTTTGAICQVGRSCLQGYTGIRPSGMWLLDWTPDDIQSWLDEAEAKPDSPSMRSDGITGYDSRRMIALAWTLSDGGKRYTSAARARDREIPSTRAEVQSIVHNRRGQCGAGMQQWVDDTNAHADTVDTATIDTVLATAQELTGDYGENARVAAASSVVTRRALGVLVSLVAMHYRKTAEAAAPKPTPPTPGYIADVKTRLRDIPAVITTAIAFETEWGWSTLVLFRTTTGHVAKWFTSSDIEFDEGDTVLLTGTVKKHGNYQGTDQTELSRCKLRPAATAS